VKNPRDRYPWALGRGARNERTDSRHGHSDRQRDGKDRRPLQAAGLHLPEQRDLRRHQRLLDYGPLGVELKRNIKDAWWHDMVHHPPLGPDGQEFSMVGLDSAIIMHPQVWKVSGHYDLFADKMVDCRACKIPVSRRPFDGD